MTSGPNPAEPQLRQAPRQRPRSPERAIHIDPVFQAFRKQRGLAAICSLMQTLDALAQATRNLPSARPDRIGLFGHSRGGGAILNYIVRAGNVRAAVLNSAGYPSDLSPQVNAPILMLHGTADSPADGGAEVTNIRMARDFEAKLRTAGKPVEAVYYEGGRHNDIFSSSTQYRDELQRMQAFLLRHLRD